jgi:predicted extracellular nuclease
MRIYPLNLLPFLLVFVFFIPDQAVSQGGKGKLITVGFYNLENLYDTIDDPATDDQEFTPAGSGKWNSERYRIKLQHLAEAIRLVGSDSLPGDPVIMGLAEVENKQVVEDLISTPQLKGVGYKIIHYDSPDKRGIDVALIYRPAIFKVTGSKTVPLRIEGKPDFFTRDILVVSGSLEHQPMVILVNHWPSRSKGEKESEPLRNAAADLCRSVVDSIKKLQPEAGIIIMGDFNDDPVNESLMNHLATKVQQAGLKTGDLYNPMWAMFENDGGTLAYKGKWNLFDQIIVSVSLVEKKKKRYSFYKAGVVKNNLLLEQDGDYAGYPFRTYAGSKYLGGFSDHLPVYIYLVRNPK